MSTRIQWLDWLAASGYGVDYNFDTDPPCTLTELAEAYHRQEPSVTVAQWEGCIRQETGAFRARAAGGCP